MFAIEIEQKITGRGHMEFQDILEGLWGFLVAFLIYVGCVMIVYYLKKLLVHLRASRPKR
ncbi:hypothetical protein DSBG_2945 [Desulfosporosinus sp. BG]|nr:hypothetical protein DSBG_2945 [Desulfosporosinus sp. BG]